MRPLLFILGALALAAAIICAERWFTVSPAARTARPYAREFVSRIEKDPRFTNIHIRVLELGSKGPVYVTGTVRCDADAAELRRTFDLLRCPVGVSWQFVVVTNPVDSVSK